MKLTIPAPLVIGPRLMPALRIPNVGTLSIAPDHWESPGRMVFKWAVDDADGKELGEGADISSPVFATKPGEDLEATISAMLPRALSSLISFLNHDAETYRPNMRPTKDGFNAAVQEWAYMNSDELEIAALDLDPEG